MAWWHANNFGDGQYIFVVLILKEHTCTTAQQKRRCLATHINPENNPEKLWHGYVVESTSAGRIEARIIFFYFF